MKVVGQSDAHDMRIALFSGNYNCVADGANNALNHLVSHLLERGAAVKIFSPTVPHPAFAPTGDLVSVPSIGFPGRSEYRMSLGLNADLRKQVRDFAPTHIHVSAPDPHGYQAQGLGHRLGVPVVTSLHTRFERYFEFYGLSFAKRWAERYLRRFYRRADLVLVPNAAIRDELAIWDLPGQPAIWSRGVDRSIFDSSRRSLDWRRAQGFGDDDVMLLFFGRLVREKGIAEFAAAMRELRDRGVAVRPMVVGDGPARREFAAMLPGGARFAGHLAGEELGMAVASADILLNPSITEAFGNVNLEAMASGLAIVSVNVSSASALIQNGIEGVLVPARDAGAMAEGVARLAGDPALRRSLGEAAALRSRDFDWAAVGDDVISAYRAVARGKNVEKFFAAGNRMLEPSF